MNYEHKARRQEIEMGELYLQSLGTVLNALHWAYQKAKEANDFDHEMLYDATLDRINHALDKKEAQNEKIKAQFEKSLKELEQRPKLVGNGLSKGPRLKKDGTPWGKTGRKRRGRPSKRALGRGHLDTLPDIRVGAVRG
jgi:hypothetical protein